jgi:CO/xanthine dehydrogenase FAD-binding subunit
VPIEPPVSSPRSLDEAYALLAAEPYRPMAGATDLLVQITGELGPPPERVLDLWGLTELRGISVDGDRLRIGALATFAELRTAPEILRELPALAEASATIGAAQIQNRATIGGNIVNASPAGDSLPLLLATDAELVLGSGRGERTVAASSFWPAYRETARAADELLLRIEIPLVAGRTVRYRKVGTRRAQAISKVVMALAWRVDGAGPGWREVRLALGSVAPTPIRARRTEQVIEGYPPSDQVAARARDTLADELEPIDDVRSTAEYRRTVAARVLHRLLRDEGGW